MSGRLQDWLLREGEAVIAESTLRAAVDRQSIYGGGLDTAILERRGMTEAALWARLATVTGLPVPAPARCDGSETPSPTPALPADVTSLLRTVPVGREGDTLDLLCAEPVDPDAIREMAARRGFTARLYVVPEFRLFAMRQRVYGEPLPARHASLLAEALGPRRARVGFSGTPGDPGRRRHEAAATPPVAPVPPARSAPPAVPSRWPPRPPAPAADREGRQPDGDAPTPLEHFLDLSGPFSTSHPEFDAEVEVEMQRALGDLGDAAMSAQNDDAGMSQGGSVAARPGAVGGQPRGSSDAATEPVRLEVVFSAPADGLATGEAAPEGSGDFATDALCRRARDPADKGRVLALRALRQRWTHPATQALLQDLRFIASADPEKEGVAQVISAIEALGELRDGTIIPLLIERLSQAGPPSRDVASAAHRTLVALCAQDLGKSQRRWQTWARSHGSRPRVEWLLEGLTHKNLEIREAAVEDLRHLTGDAFGYLARSPKRDRDRARRRFVAWWKTLSQPQRPGSPESAPAYLAPEPEAPLPPTPKAR